MVGFVIGVLVGGGATMAVLGFLAAYAEDREIQEEARKKAVRRPGQN